MRVERVFRPRQAGSLIAGNREVDSIVRNGVVKYKDEWAEEMNGYR